MSSGESVLFSVGLLLNGWSFGAAVYDAVVLATRGPSPAASYRSLAFALASFALTGALVARLWLLEARRRGERAGDELRKFLCAPVMIPEFLNMLSEAAATRGRHPTELTLRNALIHLERRAQRRRAWWLFWYERWLWAAARYYRSWLAQRWPGAVE